MSFSSPPRNISRFFPVQTMPPWIRPWGSKNQHYGSRKVISLGNTPGAFSLGTAPRPMRPPPYMMHPPMGYHPMGPPMGEHYEGGYEEGGYEGAGGYEDSGYVVAGEGGMEQAQEE